MKHPDLLDDPLAVLLHAPEAAPLPRTLRDRLAGRAARSAAATRAMRTVRWRAAPAAAGGVEVHRLYAGSARRPGEPRSVQIVELAPGACWSAPAGERLVMQGALADLPLHGYARGPATRLQAGPDGARVYVREGAGPAAPFVADAPWQDFAPGIRRRLLWSSAEGEAAMLYDAAPGAAVPHHGHGHDEECLMVDGEVFLDDLLLRRGDWQLAPAGTAHRSVGTDTGALIFAHGDLDLQLRP